MQARYVMDIGMILEDDAHYADGKGRGYYIYYVLNQSGIDTHLIGIMNRQIPVQEVIKVKVSIMQAERKLPFLRCVIPVRVSHSPLTDVPNWL